MFGRSTSWPAILLVLLGLATQGCVSGPAGPSPAPPSARTVDGSFTLTFEMAKSAWAPSEAIQGSATLSYAGSGRLELWSSGAGPLNFGYAEVGGNRNMGPAWTADCKQASIEPGSPIASALGKSGGWNGEDPNAPFYRSFFADPQVHLPAGDWDVTAVASFSEGACGGVQHELKATIRIHVTG
jgi:hypothetical protein